MDDSSVLRSRHLLADRTGSFIHCKNNNKVYFAFSLVLVICFFYL
jgi:hypothetical protein